VQHSLARGVAEAEEARARHRHKSRPLAARLRRRARRGWRRLHALLRSAGAREGRCASAPLSCGFARGPRFRVRAGATPQSTSDAPPPRRSSSINAPTRPRPPRQQWRCAHVRSACERSGGGAFRHGEKGGEKGSCSMWARPHLGSSRFRLRPTPPPEQPATSSSGNILAQHEQRREALRM
jgi:hypothetical protein